MTTPKFDYERRLRRGRQLQPIIASNNPAGSGTVGGVGGSGGSGGSEVPKNPSAVNPMALRFPLTPSRLIKKDSAADIS